MILMFQKVEKKKFLTVLIEMNLLTEFYYHFIQYENLTPFQTG